MSLFKREWTGEVTKAEFNVLPLERRARTSWLAPPMAAPAIDAAEEVALRAPPLPEIEALPIGRQRSDRPVETRAGSDEPAPLPHPPTIHAAFIVNHGQARQTELLDRLAASIELLAGERTRILARAEGELVELAGAIARRVVGRELKVDPTLIADLAMTGIDALGKGERLAVHIGDLGDDAAMESIGARLAALAPQCQIVRDPTLPRGGCVVKTEHGTVDESLESRLERVLAAVSTISGGAAKP
jgi:hypothetical protein